MNYPDILPLFEIKTILDIVKSGSYTGKVPQLMQSIWIAQGYGQKQVFGDPTNSLLLSSAALDPVAVLEQLVAQSATGDVPAQVSIPWNIVLPWLLKLAIEALEARASA